MMILHAVKEDHRTLESIAEEKLAMMIQQQEGRASAAGFFSRDAQNRSPSLQSYSNLWERWKSISESMRLWFEGINLSGELI